MDQLTLYSSDYYPWLNIRTTWAAFKNPEAQAPNQTNYVRISGGGAQAAGFFKAR